MDALELSRWTRFAAKGGIGKCTAIQDCVAESSEDLMFLKDDEIIVLMQIPDNEGVYLGYCEGVVGKFHAQTVHFHSKLKRPVMTKRNSSAMSSRVKSPTGISPTPTSGSNYRNSSSSTPVSSNPATPLTPAFERATSRDIQNLKQNSSLDAQATDRLTLSRSPQNALLSAASESGTASMPLQPTVATSRVAVQRSSTHHVHVPSVAHSETSQYSSTSASTVDIDYGLPRVMSPPSMFSESDLHIRQPSIATVMSSESMGKQTVRSESDVDQDVVPRRSGSIRSSNASTMRSNSPSSISQSYSPVPIFETSFSREEINDPRGSVASVASDGEVGIGLSLLASLGEGDSDDDSENERGDERSHDLSRLLSKSIEDNHTDSSSSISSLSVERRTLSPSPISEDAVAAFPRPPSTQVAVATTSDPINPFGTFGRTITSAGVHGGLDTIFGGRNTRDSHSSMTSSASFGTDSGVSKDTDSSESGGATAIDHFTPQAMVHEKPIELERTRSPTLASVRSNSVYSSTGQRSPSLQASSPRNLSPPSPAFPPPNFRFPAQRPDNISLPAMSPSEILPPHSPTLSHTSGASASEWEGASDIYDNYLYRYSVASKSSRLSQMSMASRSGLNHRNIPSTSTMPPTAIASMASLVNMASNLRLPSDQVSENANAQLPSPVYDQAEHTDLEEPLYTSLTAESTDTNATITPSRIPPRYDSLTMQRPSSVVASLRSLSSRRSIGSSHHPESPHHSDESDDESIYSRLSSKPSLSLLEAHAASLLAPENKEKVNTTSALNVVKASPSANITTSDRALATVKNDSRRPSPLDLTKDQIRSSERSSGGGMIGPSPLLHTRWGSPVSSNGMSSGSPYDGRSSGGYPTPPFTDMRGSYDEKNRNQAAGSEDPNFQEPKIYDTVQNDPDSSVSTITRPLVIEDDEELPSHAMDPQEGEADMSLVTMESAEFRYAEDLRNSVHSSSTSKSKNESLGVTPIVITPSIQTASTGSPSSGIADNFPISPVLPPHSNFPAASASTGQSVSRPSLAELRGYPNTAVQGQRQSLFLPHPNAPKAPLQSPGPLYIRKVENFPQLEPNPIRQGPDPNKVASNVLRMVLNKPPPPPRPVMLPPPSSIPIRGNIRRNPPAPPPPLPRGPTIYARVDVDLSTSNGPVPITFSVEPMGPPPPPLLHSQAAIQPDASLHQLPPLTSDQQQEQPQLPYMSATHVKRSVTVPTTSLPRTEPQSEPGGVIPKENTTPRPPVSRPRSKSFSTGFKSPVVGNNFSTSNDIHPVLRTRGSSASLSSTTIGPPSPTKASITSSPLRPSSLSRPSSNSKLRNVHSSPLSLPFDNSSIALSLTGGGIKAPSSPLANGFGSPLANGRASQLRKVTSMASLPGRTSLSKASSEPQDRILTTSLPEDSRRSNTTSAQDSDAVSITSSKSRVMSPPLIVPQSSLQQKFSMPNLRRKAFNKEDDVNSPITENETLQVRDMDFELVRPNIPFSPDRSSEDSISPGLGRRSESRATEGVQMHLRAESPAISVSSGISGTSRITTGVSSDSAAFRSKASSKASDSEASMDAHRQREQKWMSLITTVPPEQARKNKKVRKLLGEGVPASVRYLVWSLMTNAKSKGVAGVYSQLSKRVRVAAFADMQRDVKRCFGEHPHLQSTEGPLVCLLQAYLTMVPDVQYSTGLTLIAGHTLLLAPEEDGFWIFVSMMDSALRPYFSPNSAQMEVDAALFSRALDSNDAQVSKKVLVDMGINPAHMCFPWFTTLFVGSLPGDYVNRVWDLFLYEGVPMLIRVGLAILYCCRRAILEAASEDAILYYLKRPSPTWLPPSPDAFMALAFSFKVKDDDIRKQRIKMERQVKKQAQVQGARLVANSSGISLPRDA